MQYDVRTPEEYLAALEDDWRKETLLELRSLILEAGPGLSERIEYKMLSYHDEKGGVFGLNAQKHYVSLYVGDAAKVDPTGELLAGLNVGKGCIRFSKTKKVADTRIPEFIERTLQLRRQGFDIDC